MNIDNSNKFLRSIDTNPLPIVIIKLRTKYIIPKNAGINAKYKKGIISDNLKKQQKIIKKPSMHYTSLSFTFHTNVLINEDSIIYIYQFLSNSSVFEVPRSPIPCIYAEINTYL